MPIRVEPIRPFKDKDLPRKQRPMDRIRTGDRMKQKPKKTKNKPGIAFLTGGQAKLDKNKNNKIDAQDFKILRAEKAKGRGMGLQDEKMKPGKVKKAVVGILAQGAKKILGRKRSSTVKPQDVTMKGKRSGMGSMLVELFKKKKLGTQGISGPIILGGAMKNGGMGEAKGYKKYLQGLKKAEGEQFRAKFKAKQIAKAGGKAAMRAARATTIGKIALGVAAAGLGAKEYLKRRSRKKRERDAIRRLKEDAAVKKLQEGVGKVKKKMGGGMMMQRPMGNYMGGGLTEATQRLKAQGKMGGGMMMRPNPVGMKAGKSVKVKCKIGRNKPTKMY